MASAQKKTNYIAGWTGALAIAVVAVAIFFSAACSGWHFGLNSISDLGVRDGGKMIFNVGVMIGGVLLMIYGAARAASEEGYAQAGSAFIGVAGIFLIMLGIFNVGIKQDIFHYAVCGGASLFLALGMILNGLQLWNAGGCKRIIGGGVTVVFAISICTYIGMTNAEWQTWTVFCALLWLALDVAAYLASGIKEAA